jgi:ribosomal protein L31
LKAEIDLKSAAGTAEASSAAEKISVTSSNHPVYFAGPTRMFRF